MNIKQIPYEIIIKFIKNECTPEELHILDSWRKDSPENEQLFRDLQQEWSFKESEDMVCPDKEETWRLIAQEIQLKKIQDKQRFNIRRCIAVAASVAILIGMTASFTWFIQNKKIQTSLAAQSMTITTSAGQKTQLFLPDGTSVWLNSESKLTYSNDFNQKLREIRLEGEAFFEVTRNKDKPFVVNTADIKVCVLGTAFDVEAYPEAAEIKVSVLRGKVAVETLKHQLLGKLSPDQLVIINKKDMSCQWLGNDAETFSSWREGQLIFHNAGLDEILPKLERWYGIKFHFATPYEEEQKYSFSVKTESLRELLELLNHVMPIRYEINGKEVTISIVKK